ncbi:hypothetical protein C3L33_07654, partial [Rhododendron williamsianum]
MEESRPSFGYSGGERRLEVVSGKNFNANQMYAPSQSEPPPVPLRVTRLSHSTAAAAAAATKPWGFTDGEMKRRKRVARYKSYAIEGKVKASIRDGMRWIKNKCSQMVHGF